MVRRQQPAYVEWYDGIEVYAQPAAVDDNIIRDWQLLDLGKRYPLIRCQQDMLGACRTSRLQDIMQAIAMLSVPIAGKLTPVHQLIHTDLAVSLTFESTVEKELLSEELNIKAKQERTI